MPYAQYTLGSLTALVQGELGDLTSTYWTPQEITNGINEGLREFSLSTGYWRNTAPTTIPASNPLTSNIWTDLSAALPQLRSRSITATQIVNEILQHFSEPPAYNGGSTLGITTQFSFVQIYNALNSAYNQLVYDVGAPLTVGSQSYAVDGNNQIQLPFTTSRIARLSWLDNASGIWQRLSESSLFAADGVYPGWMDTPGNPKMYSISENTPQLVQLIPPPENSGTLEVIAVAQNPAIDPYLSLNLPNDWTHGAKYLSMALLLTADTETTSSLLAEYCMQRYTQIVEAAKLQRSVIRVLVNGKQVQIMSVTGLDSTRPYWRTQNLGLTPVYAMTMFDLATFYPVPQAPFSATFQCVTAAPQLVNQSDYIDLGSEELRAILAYTQHYLSIKMQGLELQQSLPLFDQFEGVVLSRNSLLNSQTRYLAPQFSRRRIDLGLDPDRIPVASESDSNLIGAGTQQ